MKKKYISLLLILVILFFGVKVDCVFAMETDDLERELITDVKDNIELSMPSALENENLVNPEREDTLEIATKTISEDIIQYAMEEFKSISVANPLDELNKSQVFNYRLGQGFCINKIDMEQEEIVYFPVLNENEIVAMLTVIKDENELYLGYGKTELSCAINMLRGKSDRNNPFYLYSNQDGIVAITKNSGIVIALQAIDVENIEDQNQKIETVKMKSRLRVTEDVKNRSNEFINISISDNTVFDVKPSLLEMKIGTTSKILPLSIEKQSGNLCYAYSGSAFLYS